MFTQFFVAAVLAVSAHSVSAASCSRSYVVQAGDYCDKISQAQNVSTYQLAVVNHNSVDASCSNLIPGQSLCLAETEAEDCTTTYVVRSGDTCDDIASRAGLNTTILYLNNPQIDESCSNIYTNEVLCIAPTVRSPAIPAGGVSVPAVSTTLFVAPTSTHVASTTPAAAPAKTTAAPAAAPSASDEECDGDDGDDEEDCDEDDSDDEDLPFCDEL